MTPSEIRKLVELAEYGKTKDLAIYANHVQKTEAISRKIHDLNADVRRNALSSGHDLAVSARWHAWAESEQQKLEGKAHEAAHDKELARKLAVKSSARVQALEMLLKKALAEQLILNRRRAEQNNVPPDA